MGLRGKVEAAWERLHTRHCTVAVVGLDRAGKSSVVNCLTGRGDRKVIPTVGVSKPRVVRRSRLHIKVYDLGGSVSFRPSWTDRLARSHAAIFVVDASDPQRLIEVREEFKAYLSTPEFAGKPVVILANKEDFQKIKNRDLVAHMGLEDMNLLADSSWRVLSVVGDKASNEGRVDDRLMDAIRWLEDEVKLHWTTINARVRAAEKEFQARIKAKQAENKKSVAAKRKAAAKKVKEEKKANKPSKTQVAPEPAGAASSAVATPAKPKKVVQCQNKILTASARVDCTNRAMHRGAQTGWRSICDECFARIAAPAGSPTASSPTQLQHQPANAAPAQQHLQPQQPSSPRRASPKSKLEAAVGDQISPGSPKSKLGEYAQSEAEAVRRAARKKEKREKKERKKKRRKELADSILPGTFAVDQAVAVDYMSKGNWYNGKVTFVNPDGTVSILYDDGEREDKVEPWRVAPLSGAQLPVGTRVLCRYKGKSNCYAGAVDGIASDGNSYAIKFDDGDYEKAAPRSWLRVLRK